MSPLRSSKITLIAGLTGLALSVPALAHHGFGLFEMNTKVTYEGTITGIDFVNPHSYLYFDRVDENGNTIAMKCEMRASMLLRRAGWSKEMFEPGLPITVEGNPHRNDPGACYTENITIGDRPTINRNDQFSIENTIDYSDRPDRLASGVPNISGDWAVEQAVLTVPPEGGNGALVPKRFVEAYAAGDISLEEIRSQYPQPEPPVYTERGQEEADAFENWNPDHNPRLSCKPTSIIFDWTFDWPINRITQHSTEDGENVIDMDYGLYSFSRRIHMDMEEHPADVTPSNTGHAIGHWDGDTLVVDSIGFEAGVLRPPVRNSEQMHIVEHYTFDPEEKSLLREYTVTDPVYLAEPYTGQDEVFLSEVALEKSECIELTPEFSTGSE